MVTRVPATWRWMIAAIGTRATPRLTRVVDGVRRARALARTAVTAADSWSSGDGDDRSEDAGGGGVRRVLDGGGGAHGEERAERGGTLQKKTGLGLGLGQEGETVRDAKAGDEQPREVGGLAAEAGSAVAQLAHRHDAL